MRNYKGFGAAMVLLGFVVIVFMIVVGLVVFKKNENKPAKHSSTPAIATPNPEPGAKSESPAQKYSATTNWEDVNLSDDDYQRSQDVQQMEFKMVAYKIKYQSYPADSAAADTTQQKNPLIDPTTGQPYKIVDTTPGVGEIQYKLSASCDSGNRSFEPDNSNNIFAFLVRLSEGSYICKSNVN